MQYIVTFIDDKQQVRVYSPVGDVEGAPLDLHREVIDSVDDNGTEDEHGAEDYTDDDDVGQVRLLSRRQQAVNRECKRDLRFPDNVLQDRKLQV